MKKYINWIMAIIVSVTISSCADRLGISNTNSLTAEDIQNLLKTGNSATTSMVLASIANNIDAAFREGGSFNGFSGGLVNYIQGQDILLNLSANDVVLGDQTTGGGASSDEAAFYKLQVDQNTPWSADNTVWNKPYWNLPAWTVTVANKPLMYLTPDVVNSTTALPVVKIYRASALCARAYAYMILMQRYQKSYLHGGKDGKGMPIYTEYKVNNPVAPSSAIDTYKSIIGWLTEAIQLFKAADPTNNGYTTNIPDDIDCGVAQYLLARADLETGDYTGCIAACQDLLSHYPNFISEGYYGIKNNRMNDIQAGTYDVNSTDNAFLSIANNPECILGFQNSSSKAQTYYNLEYNPFSVAKSCYYRIDPTLWNLIDANDFRKDNAVLTAFDYTFKQSGQPDKAYTVSKYASLKYGATIAMGRPSRDITYVSCDYTYYRSSEVVLMLAEAQEMNGNDPAAKTTLNTLLAARTRAGVSPLTCNTYAGGAYASKTLDLIKLQWRIEMWGENATDYFNAKRWNTPVSRVLTNDGHWSIGTTLPIDNMTWSVPNMDELNTNNMWK